MTNSIKICLKYTVLFYLFLFGCTKEELILPPTVLTLEASSIQQKSVVLTGNITDDGLSPITEKGFYVSMLNSNPNSQDTKINLGAGKDIFEKKIDSLIPNSKYYYKTFAKNIKGEANGMVFSFTTLDISSVLLSTETPQNVSYFSALLTGKINSDGGGVIKEKGFCLSTNSNPTINDMKFPIEKTGNSLSLVVVKLNENTTYYFRTYSINEKGEAYGNEQNFKTLKTQLAKVSTLSATDITQTSAKLGGSILDDGGLELIEKGICYSNSNSPSIKDNKVFSTAESRQYFSTLASLPFNSNLFFRAYAINKLGVSYGEIMSFKLLYTKVLTVITSPVSKNNINDYQWNYGGELLDDGGAAIEDVGIVVGLKPQPTTSDNYLRESFFSQFKVTPHKFSGTPQIFNVDFFNKFAKSITYYIRAYANNSKERIYGNEIVYQSEPIFMEKLGGYIGYIYQKGDLGYIEGEEHGIIVSKELFSRMKWGCKGTNIIGAEKLGLGGGKPNTDDIVKDCSSQITPASICKNLNLGGYSDWVLPSAKELEIIAKARSKRIPYLLGAGNLWTSTEKNSDEAYYVNVNDFQRIESNDKNYEIKFLAIRYY